VIAMLIDNALTDQLVLVSLTNTNMSP